MRTYTYKKILIPHDGSTFSSGIIPYVAPLAAACQADVHLLHVLNTVTEDYTLMNTANTEMYPTYSPSLANIESMQAIQKIQKHKVVEEFKHVKSILEAYNIPKIITHFEEGLETELIIDFAKAKHCNLIAMSSFGRGGIKRMVLGSVADYIIRNAPCPVLVVHPHLE